MNLHPASDCVDFPGNLWVAPTPSDAIRRDIGDAVTAMPRWMWGGMGSRTTATAAVTIAVTSGDDAGDDGCPPRSPVGERISVTPTRFPVDQGLAAGEGPQRPDSGDARG